MALGFPASGGRTSPSASGGKPVSVCGTGNGASLPSAGSATPIAPSAVTLSESLTPAPAPTCVDGLGTPSARSSGGREVSHLRPALSTQWCQSGRCQQGFILASEPLEELGSPSAPPPKQACIPCESARPRGAGAGVGTSPSAGVPPAPGRGRRPPRSLGL